MADHFGRLEDRSLFLERVLGVARDSIHLAPEVLKVSIELPARRGEPIMPSLQFDLEPLADLAEESLRIVEEVVALLVPLRLHLPSFGPPSATHFVELRGAFLQGSLQLARRGSRRLHLVFEGPSLLQQAFSLVDPTSGRLDLNRELIPLGPFALELLTCRLRAPALLLCLLELVLEDLHPSPKLRELLWRLSELPDGGGMLRVSGRNLFTDLEKIPIQPPGPLLGKPGIELDRLHPLVDLGRARGGGATRAIPRSCKGGEFAVATMSAGDPPTALFRPDSQVSSTHRADREIRGSVHEKIGPQAGKRSNPGRMSVQRRRVGTVS